MSKADFKITTSVSHTMCGWGAQVRFLTHCFKEKNTLADKRVKG